MAPSSTTACQNPPFNVFTLTCTVTLSNPVTLEERIEWRRGPEGSEVTLSTDGLNTVISSSNLGDPTSTSVLTVSNRAAGIERYVCVAILDFPDNDEQIQQSDSAEVTIKGSPSTCFQHHHLCKYPIFAIISSHSITVDKCTYACTCSHVQLSNDLSCCMYVVITVMKLRGKHTISIHLWLYRWRFLIFPTSISWYSYLYLNGHLFCFFVLP